MRSYRVLAGVFAAVMAAGLGAQEFPARPITIVFPGAPGIQPDRVARLVADTLKDRWGQPVVVENRAGAGGNIGAEYVAKAAPDGHTLLFTGAGTLVISKIIFSKLAYDPEAFVPLSVVYATPIVVAVNTKVPAQTVQQFIALARSQPGKLNYGSAGTGTTTHLAGELIKSLGGLDMVHIPYKGLGPAMTDLLGGQVDAVMMDIGTSLANHRAGKLRVLAVTTKNRSALLPDVPAVGEVLPGYEAAFAFVMVAPPKTPAAIANRLSAAVGEAVRQPDIVKQLQETGTEVVGSSAAEMASFLVQEKGRYEGLVRSLGIRGD
jgi:tripartite-type tricarboxylate transporter receptor subunit TctC